ncbi:MAG: hypothetical protein ACRDH0_13580 [Actinomycetota bacterium]
MFERIPEGGFIGDVRRYLSVGPDDQIYWMRLLEDGLQIYRRADVQRSREATAGFEIAFGLVRRSSWTRHRSAGLLIGRLDLRRSL